MYSVLNPNAVLYLVRSTVGTPAFMYGDTLVLLYSGRGRFPSVEKLDEVFRRVLGRGLFDVVRVVEIERVTGSSILSR